MTLPLRISNLTKVYKYRGEKRIAVDSLSIDVSPGTIFGFLGPNGAGKTTTIKSALDFIRPTSGSAEIFGIRSTEPMARSNVGYLPEQPYFHRFLKPMELLMAHASLAGVPRNEVRSHSTRALEQAGVAEYATTPISKLSKGLTQRVGIAQSLVSNPRLLILDEPASGLDPVGRRHIRDLLQELRNEGKTVFLSSHILSEVESLCDTVAILKKGQLVFCGKPDDAKTEGDRIVVRTMPVEQSLLDRMRYLNAEIQESDGLTVFTVSSDEIYPLMHALESADARIVSTDTVRESMEEAFLRLAA